MLIQPFTAIRPSPKEVASLVAPPYDVVSSEEAKQLAAGKPHSFFYISKPEINGASHEMAAILWQQWQKEGVLLQDNAPAYYVYQMASNHHTQTGLVAAVALQAYETGRVRRHELTRPDKEQDRAAHIAALKAETGPVMLAYRYQAAVQELIEAAIKNKPLYAVQDREGVWHRLWQVVDTEKQAQLTAAFEAISRLYIADGHHRCAAAYRVAKAEGRVLAVIFPDSQMNILDYNRVVKDLNGLSWEDFLAAVKKQFSVEKLPQFMAPTHAKEWVLYAQQGAYRLKLLPEVKLSEEITDRLDVSLLGDHLLAPILGITDVRNDPRIDFVGGSRGIDGLKSRVDSGEMTVAFALYPTSMASLLAVADAGKLMPPKSTWFEPKLLDGFISLPL